MLDFTLSFEGADALHHKLEFYDAAQALVGFQRSLALTAHLVINGQIITQAPALKNAKIIATPPEEGSWKFTAVITSICIGFYQLTTTPKDTPLGHIMYSAYDYVINETLGFHVDYNKSLGKSYEEMRINKSSSNLPLLEQHQFDSLIEKCEGALKEMHRPIVKSKTARECRILHKTASGWEPIGIPLNADTWDYIQETTIDNELTQIKGKISSYNINTYKGRIFSFDEQRPVSFLLADTARTPQAIDKITTSLRVNAINRLSEVADVDCLGYKYLSRNGRLKSYFIIEVM